MLVQGLAYFFNGFAQLFIGLSMPFHCYPRCLNFCHQVILQKRLLNSGFRSKSLLLRYRASARNLSFSALASFWIRSWIHSYSRLCSLLASWRALVASMSCCKMGESLPSDLYGPCLVFLIMLEGSIMNADGIVFYRAPRWAPNVLVG